MRRSGPTRCIRSASLPGRRCRPRFVRSSRPSKTSLRDGIDRILVDLASLYRDILLLQLAADVELVNRELEPEMRRAAASATPAASLATLDAIQTARERIDGNVQPALALEAMLVSAIRTTASERGVA
jgi:DNA polymerase-3 subunit delta'